MSVLQVYAIFRPNKNVSCFLSIQLFANCIVMRVFKMFVPPRPHPTQKKKTALVAEYQVIIPLIGDCWGTRLPMRVINTPGHTCWISTFKFKTFHIKIKDFLWMIQKFWQFCWGIRYILSRNSFKINCLALLWKKLDRFKFCIYLGVLFDLFLILA